MVASSSHGKRVFAYISIRHFEFFFYESNTKSDISGQAIYINFTYQYVFQDREISDIMRAIRTIVILEANVTYTSCLSRTRLIKPDLPRSLASNPRKWIEIFASRAIVHPALLFSVRKNR